MNYLNDLVLINDIATINNPKIDKELDVEVEKEIEPKKSKKLKKSIFKNMIMFSNEERIESERLIAEKKKLEEEEKRILAEKNRERRKYLLQFKINRDEYILKLCVRYNVSYNYIIKLGGFKTISDDDGNEVDVDDDFPIKKVVQNNVKRNVLTLP